MEQWATHISDAPPLILPPHTALRKNDRPIPVNATPLTVDEKQCINGIRKRIKERARPHHRRSSPPSIFRVPEHIQKIGGHTSSGHLYDKSYRPLMVHIGPYHRNLSELPRFATVEAYKWQCLRALLSRHKVQEHASKQLNVCLQWLLKAEVQAAVRECYSEELELEAGNIAQLMLVDACFIIHLLLQNAIAQEEIIVEEKVTVVKTRFWDLLRPTKKEGKEQGETSKNKKRGPRREIGSLQHQGTPMTEIEVGEQETSSIEDEDMFMIDINEEDREIQAPLVEGLWTWNLAVYDLLKLENQIPLFLIETLYDNLKTPNDVEDLSSLVLKLFSHIRPKKADKFTIHGEEKFYHLLHMFHASLFHEIKQYTGHREKAPARIPSATELKRAWIKIKRKEVASSFLDITYKNTFFGGVIEIPKLQVYDYTDSIFSNLIAFEQCFPFITPQHAYITLYCVLMDCIIDTAEDARVLNSEGILVSRLSNQEPMADLFNKLCKEIDYKIQGSYLDVLFAEVNNAYESWWRKSYVSLRRNYFANPWAFISFVILLLLSVEQAVFAALSYYRQ